MSEWEPTMRLRFVELPLILGKNGERLSGGRVLQQEWAKHLVDATEQFHPTAGTLYEWRDVPLVKEGEE